jgi:serine/threonine protein kinase
MQHAPPSPGAAAATTDDAAPRCESDSNDEPLLFQLSSTSVPPTVPQAVRLRSAVVNATPPFALLDLKTNSDGDSLFPSSIPHAECACTPQSQSIPVGRDLSNRHPLISSMKPPLPQSQLPLQRTADVGAASAVLPAIPATHADSNNNNSELETAQRLGVAGRTANASGNPSGARRSLFRSAAHASDRAPASSLTGGGLQWSQRAHGDPAVAVVPNTPTTPALTSGEVSWGVSGGDAVLVMEPPTPAKQRRTIHTDLTRETHRGNGGSGGYMGFQLRVSCTAASSTPQAVDAPLFYSQPSSGAATNNGVDAAASPAKSTSRRVAPLGMPPTSPSLLSASTPSATRGGNNANGATACAAPSLSFKFHKREGSRKRSADALSQFSALDLDETPATPYGQAVLNGGRFHSLACGVNVFPSQPSASAAAMRGVGNNNCNGFTSFPPTSPLMGGYATPVTLSQQIGGSNTFSQMLLHPSQDVLDMSQADTECSNFLARRIVNDYNEVRLLGRGSFGTVSLYKEISSGEYVAVKMSPPLRAPDMERRYRRERSIMGMVRGMPHVVQLSAAWEEGRIPRMYLQLEYCPGGSVAALASAKQSRNEPWSEEEVKVFLTHMSIALDALHRTNIAHVDFKPDNVLIDKDGAYKLSDFGCSVLLDDNGRPRVETQNGYGTSTSPGKAQPPAHSYPQRGGGGGGGYGSPTAKRDAAAETLNNGGGGGGAFNWNEANESSTASVDEGDCRYLCADMLNEKKYFKAGDMFSLGMSLYELMSGQPLPRNGDQFLALRRQVPAEMLRRRGYSTFLVKLVAALLHSDATQRPTARQVLQYLRPSPEELQLLADPSAMQQWTTDAGPFVLPAEQQQQQHEREQSGGGGCLRRTAAALRCVSALMEGSCWLFTTTQQDVNKSLTKAAVESGDEEAEQHRQQQLQRGQPCAPLPPQRKCRGGELREEVDGFPMSPIVREEACTPTTLNY